MKALPIIAGVFLLLAALCIGPWIWWDRIQDCKSLGHGTLYCVVVWGGK